MKKWFIQQSKSQTRFPMLSFLMQSGFKQPTHTKAPPKIAYNRGVYLYKIQDNMVAHKWLLQLFTFMMRMKLNLASR